MGGGAGYHTGFIVGTIFNNAKVVNCIVKNSKIITPATLSANGGDVFLGGIAGSVGDAASTDPGAGNRYQIANCYVSANIQVMLAGSTIAAGSNISSGGIVGRIHKQPVWPENCFYKGTINTNYPTNTVNEGGYIGPIFGSVLGDEAIPSPNFNGGRDAVATRIWSGTSPMGGTNPNLTMTSYYTEYTAKLTAFISSQTTGDAPVATTHRIATTTAGLGYVQGVNKRYFYK